MSGDKSMRDHLSQHWRPFGYWGLSINTVFGFPALMAIGTVKPELVTFPMMVTTYGTVLTAFVGAAIVRHAGKKNGEL
jgi:hypothetical protein